MLGYPSDGVANASSDLEQRCATYSPVTYAGINSPTTILAYGYNNDTANAGTNKGDGLIPFDCAERLFSALGGNFELDNTAGNENNKNHYYKCTNADNKDVMLFAFYNRPHENMCLTAEDLTEGWENVQEEDSNSYEVNDLTALFFKKLLANL